MQTRPTAGRLIEWQGIVGFREKTNKQNKAKTLKQRKTWIMQLSSLQQVSFKQTF